MSVKGECVKGEGKIPNLTQQRYPLLRETGDLAVAVTSLAQHRSRMLAQSRRGPLRSWLRFGPVGGGAHCANGTFAGVRFDGEESGYGKMRIGDEVLDRIQPCHRDIGFLQHFDPLGG